MAKGEPPTFRRSGGTFVNDAEVSSQAASIGRATGLDTPLGPLGADELGAAVFALGITTTPPAESCVAGAEPRGGASLTMATSFAVWFALEQPARANVRSANPAAVATARTIGGPCEITPTSSTLRQRSERANLPVARVEHDVEPRSRSYSTAVSHRLVSR